MLIIGTKNDTLRDKNKYGNIMQVEQTSVNVFTEMRGNSTIETSSTQLPTSCN